MADDTRPDPDRLLNELRDADARAKRGRLHVFFGSSAGVGKTYSMLEAARVARAAGRDIVIGYVQPHGRIETERLMEGLEQLPTLPIRQHGIVLHEFDLDAALRRHPEVLLVDEFAHSNPTDGEPHPRHAKRWQDIEELLGAGISIWTTVNVQHIEGLNDLVAGITGVRQQETVPDRLFEQADEVELIDLPAEDLLARVRAGKVYTENQANRALENFFRPANLTALRELALRKTADRVDASMRALRSADASARPWLARDRLIVAPGMDDQAEQLVRTGKRVADGLDAEWIVVYVETPRLLRLSEAQRNRRIAVLRLAESLGAETVTLDGPAVAETLLEYARTRRVNRIIVGHPKRHGLKSLWRPSTVTGLLAGAGPIDVMVVGEVPASPLKSARLPPSSSSLLTERPARPLRWRRYLGALAITAACTGLSALIGYLYPALALANIVMIYLLGGAIAGRFGRRPAIITSVANVLALDFFFVPPRFTFAVADFQYIITFAVMLIIALALANLMVSVRLQTRIAGHRERRTAALYAMSRELSQARGADNMARIAMRHVSDVFASRAVVLLAGSDGLLKLPAETVEGNWLPDLSIAEWVYHHTTAAGLGTDTLAGAGALYLPVHGSKHMLGVLAVNPENVRRILLPEQRHLLETFSGQLALALERAELAGQAETARVAAETEGLRNSLLSSISHDLRTPLAVISGASSTLAENPTLDAATRTALARSIHEHARAMSDLVSDVLDLMRLESGAVQLRLEEYDLEELLGSVLHRLEEPLRAHQVIVDLPADLPPLVADGALLSQVLTNLLDNAARHTPAGTTITVAAHLEETRMHVIVADNGPGLPPGDPARLFQKFQRGQSESAVVGVGLGLAICQAIVAAHGGVIQARERAGGGAQFELTLPLAGPVQ
jgi:two-component system, OmpR family, sensor histidine kinase KdpD